MANEGGSRPDSPMRDFMRRFVALFVLTFAILSCASTRRAVPSSDEPLLDDVEKRSFHFFWDLADPQTFLIPDRAPTPSFSSIAAVGFGLAAYGIGAERGYVTREAARDRVLLTLRTFLNLPQGPAATGMGGYHGFFYHFLDMESGVRFKDVELSTIDTTWLLAGALFCQSYFDRNDPTESAIRDAAE